MNCLDLCLAHRRRSVNANSSSPSSMPSPLPWGCRGHNQLRFGHTIHRSLCPFSLLLGFSRTGRGPSQAQEANQSAAPRLITGSSWVICHSLEPRKTCSRQTHQGWPDLVSPCVRLSSSRAKTKGAAFLAIRQPWCSRAPLRRALDKGCIPGVLLPGFRQGSGARPWHQRLTSSSFSSTFFWKAPPCAVQTLECPLTAARGIARALPAVVHLASQSGFANC